MDLVKYLIEGLRNKPNEPGIYREAGRVPRQVRGPAGLKNARDDVNYTKYRKQQSAIGETPVSYEEWIK